MQTRERSIGIKIIWGIVILCSLMAAVSKTLVGFDIDEGYALALPCRLLQGDKLFTQMWEVHQTSSLFGALILYPFLKITGDTTYLVLYVRIVCGILHLLVSILVLRTLRLVMSKDSALFLAVVYFNFLPKWMMTVDFSMQFTWFFTICILCMIYAEYNRDKVMETQADRKTGMAMLGCGISLALLVLGYPTMLVLYPLWLLGICVRKEQKPKQRIREALWLTAGCAIPALCFLLYLFSYMNLHQLLHNIQNVFSDGSHQFSGASKWSLWLGHGRDVAVQTLITLAPALAITGALGLAFRLHARKAYTGQAENIPAGYKYKEEKFPFLPCLVLVYMFLTSLIVVVAKPAGIAWGPFRLQIRYLVMFAMGFCLAAGMPEHGRERRVRRICLYPSLVAFAGILLASNVGPASSSSYLIVGVMAMLRLVMCRMSAGQEGIPEEACKKYSIFLKGTLGLFLLSLILCKGFYVRVTGYPPSDLLMERERITAGPAKGIYVYPKEREEMQETYDKIREYTDNSDQVLYLGTQALSNLYTDGKMVLPTTISTPAFNEQWIAYFEQNPDQMPTVIFLSKTTVDDQEKFFGANPFGQWIASHYDVKNRIEADYLCVIR